MKREKKQFKYQLIHDALAAKIAAGLLDKLPSEEELGKEFDAGRNIVRQALQILSEEGYIVKQQGRRTQICRKNFADPVKEAKLVLLQRHDYQGINDNPVYSGIISGLLEIAAKHSCHLELLYLPAAGNVQYTKFAAAKLRKADGIFMTALRRNEPQSEIEDILQHHPRTICIDNAAGTIGRYRVGTDNYSGGWMAAQLIKTAGKTSPLLYGCGDTVNSYSPMIERAMGFCDGCHAMRCSFNRKEHFVLDDVYPEFHVIYDSMKKLLDSGKVFDCVFVLSDPAAVNVVRALRTLGRRVPEDIAVVGFDGIASNGEFKALTSIRQNVEAVAEQSFAIMEKLLRNEVVTGSISLVPPSIKEGTTL